MLKMLKVAKEREYMVVTGRKPVIEYTNKFYRYCRQNKIPYIIVRNRNKYCEVEADTITLPVEFDRNLDKYAQDVCSLIDRARNEGHLDKRQTWSAGMFTHFTVKKEFGEYYAEEIIGIVRKYS